MTFEIQSFVEGETRVAPVFEVPRPEGMTNSITLDGLQKNMQEIGTYLELHIRDFSDVRFSLYSGWAPSMPELALPTIEIIIYSDSHWCQLQLKDAHAMSPAKVYEIWLTHKEPRHGPRAPGKGVWKEAVETKPQSKTKNKVALSLEDLDL